MLLLSWQAGDCGRLQAAANQTAPPRPPASEWLQLFNGKNLDGWVPKIAGFDLGVNYNDTFRVEDGFLKASYDKYKTFDNRFGHLFYRQKFWYYVVAAEYRFVGEQTADAPAWALRNNGLMLHSQAPETMGKDQDFPISDRGTAARRRTDRRAVDSQRLHAGHGDFHERRDGPRRTARTRRRKPIVVIGGYGWKWRSGARSTSRTMSKDARCSSTTRRRSAAERQPTSTRP